MTTWRDRITFAYIDEPPFAAPLPDGKATGCDIDLALTGLRTLGVRNVELRILPRADTGSR